MISAREALQRLQEGNRRFAAGKPTHFLDRSRRADLVQEQKPFAIVLGCSDSRVPVEIVFDQGLGDLFVIRVAGNIVAPSQLGSIEFAASRFGSRLVVVLGHSQCGAIQATLEALRQSPGTESPGLRSVVQRIRPAVEGILWAEPGQDGDALQRRAVRANVENSVAHLSDSPILRAMMNDEGLAVIGAEYSLETGIVEFFGPSLD